MIARYTRQEMGALWSDEARYRTWLAVEVAVTDALARRGFVPQADADAIHAGLPDALDLLGVPQRKGVVVSRGDDDGVRLDAVQQVAREVPGGGVTTSRGGLPVGEERDERDGEDR